jgi:ribonuclease P protein component
MGQVIVFLSLSTSYMDRLTYTFPKAEHLKSTKTIQLLFNSGQQVFQYPFKVMFLIDEQHLGYPQVLCSASKRFFKHAVDRNKIKRMTKEAYRLHKPHLLPIEDGKIMAIAFIYVGKKIEPYATMHQSMKKALQKLLASI